MFFLSFFNLFICFCMCVFVCFELKYMEVKICFEMLLKIVFNVFYIYIYALLLNRQLFLKMSANCTHLTYIIIHCAMTCTGQSPEHK